MSKNNKTRLWYVVLTLGAMTVIVPFVAAVLWGEKLEFRHFVVGPIIIAAVSVRYIFSPMRVAVGGYAPSKNPAPNLGKCVVAAQREISVQHASGQTNWR